MIPTASKKEAKKMRISVSNKVLAIGIAAGLLGVGTAYTQFRGATGAEYSTADMNPQRTSSSKTDRYISKDNFSKGGFKLQWKLKVEGGTPRDLFSVVGGTTSGGGLTKPLNAILTANNTISTVDDDTGIPGWAKHFSVAAPASGGTLACPSGMTANASRPVVLSAPEPGAARGGLFGGGGAGAAGGRAPVGYQSVLGEPGQGLPADVVTRGGGRAPAAAPSAAGAARGAGGAAGAPGAPAAAGAALGAGAAAGAGAARGGRAAGGAGGGGGGFGGAAPTYKTPFPPGRFGSGGGFFVVTSDGVLHTMGDGSGKEVGVPVKFLPPNARVSDLTAVPENNDEWHSFVVYAATTNSCGGAPNRVWAVNLADDAHPITHVDTGASVVGDPAFSSEGTIFVALGKGPAGAAHSNAILALEPKTLTIKDWFTDPKADFSSTPMVITLDGKEFIAVATADGRIYVLDATSLGGADHKTALYTSPAFSKTKTDYVPSSLAFWQESDGNMYIAEPFAGAGPSGLNATVTNGGILALKVSGSGTSITLVPAWVSPDMTSPGGPVVVDGVMFALSTGEYHPAAGSSATVADRVQKSVPAVLYALDSNSGTQLWSSDKTITSFAATPLWTGSGQAYVATHDNTVYAFGFSEERYATPSTGTGQ